MKKHATAGKRVLKGDVWHDDNGPIPGTPAGWSPPMSETEIEEAARSDPEAQPSTPEELARMRRISIAKHARWRAGMSQSEFAATYGIPIGTLRDWEQHRSEPDATAVAYLTRIAANPSEPVPGRARVAHIKTIAGDGKGGIRVTLDDGSTAVSRKPLPEALLKSLAGRQKPRTASARRRGRAK